MKAIFDQVVSFEQQDETSKNFIGMLQAIGIDNSKIKSHRIDHETRAEKEEEEPNGTEEGEGWHNIGS